MQHGDGGGAGVSEQHRQRHAHNVRVPHDHHVAPVHRHAAALQQLDDPQGGAGDEAGGAATHQNAACGAQGTRGEGGVGQGQGSAAAPRRVSWLCSMQGVVQAGAAGPALAGVKLTSWNGFSVEFTNCVAITGGCAFKGRRVQAGRDAGERACRARCTQGAARAPCRAG